MLSQRIVFAKGAIKALDFLLSYKYDGEYSFVGKSILFLFIEE
jgi:hypothetical protein